MNDNVDSKNFEKSEKKERLKSHNILFKIIAVIFKILEFLFEALFEVIVDLFLDGLF